MNTERDTRMRPWQTNLLMTAGVMITILLALILAQLDALQARAAVIQPGLPIVNIQATAIAVGNVIPLEIGSAQPLPVEEMADVPPPDDLNPRPAFITGVSEEGIIFTVCGEVPEGWLLYTVKPGETLASLAAGTETAAAELAAANCLTDGQVTAGMQLLVPREPAQTQCGPPQWWARYQVQRGDTLGMLAAGRGTTIDEVLRANCRDSLDLQAGQWIFLPPGSAPGSPPNVPPVAQPSLTPLPTPTDLPTLVPLPTATTGSEPPPSPTVPAATLPPPPTASPPPLPTDPPPSLTPVPPPTNPPPTDPPPTNPPPTAEPPTVTPPPPPTVPPPTATPVTPPTVPPPEPTQEPPNEEGGE